MDLDVIKRWSAISIALERKMAKSSDDVAATDVPELYLDLNPCRTLSTDGKGQSGKVRRTAKVEEALSNCVLDANFENQFGVGPYTQSVRGAKKLRRREKSDSKGKAWFNMRKPEVDDATKKDLQLLKMRSLLDPSRPYRNQDLRKTPKFFHVGTVVEHPSDFYSERIPRKKRGKTLVDELMADANFQNMQRKRMAKVFKESRQKQLVKNKILRKQRNKPKNTDGKKKK